MINEQAVSKFCLRQPHIPRFWNRKRGISACQKNPYRTFLTALSAEHFESFQNAVAESLYKGFQRRFIQFEAGLAPSSSPAALLSDFGA